MAERGTTGLPLFNGRLALDPNPKLRGRAGLRVFTEMRHDEPAARAFLAACTSLLRTDVQVEPAGTKRQDKQAAAFLQSCVDDLEDGVGRALRQMFSMLWAGWSLHEVIYRQRDDGRVGWARWSLRRQDSFERWETQAGAVVGMTQRPAPDYLLRTIPLNRCIHVIADDSDGSPEGLSLLRGMYRPWYLIKNTELLLGIALERFGTGVPIFEVDAEARLESGDIETLQASIAGLRQNEEAGVVTPKGVRFRFAESPGLKALDYLEAIRYWRVAALSTVLADFITLGTGVQGGAYALGTDKSELFLLSLNGYQERIMDAINRQAVRRLFLNANAGRFASLSGIPKLTLPTIKRYDLTALGGFAKVLHEIGLLHATPEDEAHMRRISDLVDLDIGTLRDLHTVAPQPEPGPIGGDAPGPLEPNPTEEEEAATVPVEGV